MNLLILVTFCKIFGFFYIDNRGWSEILASSSQFSMPFTIIIVVWLIFTGQCFQREQERCSVRWEGQSLQHGVEGSTVDPGVRFGAI